MFRTFLLLFSPAWDPVEFTLEVGFICSFVVSASDSVNLG